MLNRTEILQILRDNLASLQREYGLKSLEIFGSVARDEVRDNSDVDLIADFNGSIGLRFVEFVDRIEGLLGIRADVLTPAGIAGIRNPRVAEAIKESAIRV